MLKRKSVKTLVIGEAKMQLRWFLKVGVVIVVQIGSLCWAPSSTASSNQCTENWPETQRKIGRLSLAAMCNYLPVDECSSMSGLGSAWAMAGFAATAAAANQVLRPMAEFCSASNNPHPSREFYNVFFDLAHANQCVNPVQAAVDEIRRSLRKLDGTFHGTFGSGDGYYGSLRNAVINEIEFKYKNFMANRSNILGIAKHSSNLKAGEKDVQLPGYVPEEISEKWKNGKITSIEASRLYSEHLTKAGLYPPADIERLLNDLQDPVYFGRLKVSDHKGVFDRAANFLSQSNDRKRKAVGTEWRKVSSLLTNPESGAFKSGHLEGFSKTLNEIEFKAVEGSRFGDLTKLKRTLVNKSSEALTAARAMATRAGQSGATSKMGAKALIALVPGAGIAFDTVSYVAEASELGCEGDMLTYGTQENIDGQCVFVAKPNRKFTEFLQLDESIQQMELARDPKFCDVFLKIYNNTFFTNWRIQCLDSGLEIIDAQTNSKRRVFWNPTTQKIFRAEIYDDENPFGGFVGSYKNDDISSIEIPKRSTKRTPTGAIDLTGSITPLEALDIPPKAEDADKIPPGPGRDLRVQLSWETLRYLELQSCCTNRIQDDRCKGIDGHSKAPNPEPASRVRKSL